MGSWLPYTPSSSKDCSQRKICSLRCPQWCYKNIIFPPPPPPLQFPADHFSSSSSTLLIVIIGVVLASALLLYFIISKYSMNNADSASPSPSSSSSDPDEEDHIDRHTIHEPWFVAGKGVDESIIKSIAMFKFKNRGNGILVQGTECSVCLSEFHDEESLKLLPNCSHPFHANCIDTWLKSHSNCPLCRANIVNHISPSTPSASSSNSRTTSQLGSQFQPQPEASINGNNPNNSFKRVLSDLGRVDSTIIEIRDHKKLRRTMSMDQELQKGSRFS